MGMNVYISSYSVGKRFAFYRPVANLRTRVPWLARLWLLVPPTIRAFAYDIIRKRLPTITGSNLTSVWKIWPGVILKASPGIPVFEARALLLVREYTRIPSPRLYDIVVRPGGDSEWGDTVYILMSKMPGQTLATLLAEKVLGATEQAQIALDIRGYMDDLQNIPNPYPTPICSAGGPELWSYYLQDGLNRPVVPAMESVAAFHDYEKTFLSPTTWERLKPRLQPIFDQRYEIVFTHGDLNPSNIMIHKGRVSGLIDWEFSGWMPEYWDFVAAMMSGRYWDDPFRMLMKEAGMERYLLEVHGQLSFFGYLIIGSWDDVPAFDS